MIRFPKVLQAKITAEKIDAQLPKHSMVTIVNTAQPGMSPVSPNKTLIIVAGAVAGILLALMAGTVAAFLAFFIRKRIGKTASAS